jgi:COX assembly mitochondrial protein 2
MNALEECHAKGFMWKAMGNCNDAKDKLMVCIRAERERRAAANRDKARDRKERLKKFKESGLDS